MARDEAQFKAAKRAYQSARDEGNHQEEARWANVIGDILKNRGEYVEALKWLRIDYDVTSKYLTEKHLLPTCQSLGEMYLRLEFFEDALFYQKKHLELAKDSDDLVEQQRASTQLGRTYHEMFLRSVDDHYSIRNAKKYFKSAMKLAKELKENPPTNKCSFLKEYIDAHNNIGMLEIDLDNLVEAQKILSKGLDICDEEEVIEDDDGRSRLHHNLGNVFMESRMWNEAREHIEKDIIICKRIGHCQGEAKGYINLGELHYRVQKYDEAILCYQKAHDLAQSMEDEDALMGQINQNIDTVNEAIKVMGELRLEEQNFKKLSRKLVSARGTGSERKWLLQQNKSLDSLIEKSSMITAWLKHLEFAKRKKRIASELCDKEKLSDSYLVIGESYQKLRKFDKALKWYNKSWEIYKSIGNMEGQALVKINIGDVLDCDGNWAGALDAFEEGYRISVEANLLSVQLSALENMHYSHMIRFDNVEEARRLQLLIDKLKQSDRKELEGPKTAGDCCPETDTEGDDYSLNSRSSTCSSPLTSNSYKRKLHNTVEELNDDAPLISFLHSKEVSPKFRTVAPVEKYGNPVKHMMASSRSSSKSSGDMQKVVNRKRIRLVLSDDEGEMHAQAGGSMAGPHSMERTATSDETGNKAAAAAARGCQDAPGDGSECTKSFWNLVNVEESTCSYRTRSSNRVASENGKEDRSLSTKDVFPDYFVADSSKCDFDVSNNLSHTVHLDFPACADKSKLFVSFKIDNELIHVEAESFGSDDEFDIDSVKAELACLYYLHLSKEKRSKGLLPIIQKILNEGKPLPCLEAVQRLRYLLAKGGVEVLVHGWIQKPLMKLYVDCCEDLTEQPNMKLLKRLYNLEVSEDEVILSECELQDVSVTPLLNALRMHGTIAMLNLSHNLLGNGTMEKLQQVFQSSGQSYGDLSLDLHCNRFGPTALFQICECPVLFERLAVLNISGNRLTDACGSYISTILKNCRALYSLNVERCSLTSRTINKAAEALEAGSMLTQLYIGHNDLISGNAIIYLLSKLASLERFSELSLSGLKLSKTVVDSLCRISKRLSLSGLMLGGTNIGADGALQLSESLLFENHELVKLDLSFCGLASKYFSRQLVETLVCGIVELNLGGNLIEQEGINALASALVRPQCSIKVLILNKCKLGLSGVVEIIQALAENDSLKELNLAGNVENKEIISSSQIEISLMHPHSSLDSSAAKEIDPARNGPCIVNRECNQLEVADSEDGQTGIEPDASGVNHSCASSWERIGAVESPLVEKLSMAIGMAKQLESLDLSNNGFSLNAAESFYAAWSASRGSLAHRHISKWTVHLSCQANKCCRLKPCCKRD
ncbi:protein TONSOKU isoform X2 [Rhodamnia argentea]|uniref:Protein TONSOKU isoform X2 n=1 Tax=Rhodamnia argentea TaxID=178133 RepID=A0ABM3HU77_9MYRT|nr:protein TONSOKU isoform X2 [Rhodamnia argentea]